jgi:glutathione S-transferase
MTDELVFYTNPMSRGRIVRWMLEEVGAPYRTELLDLRTTLKEPEYLAINPMGKVPAITHRGVVITECAAICAYLADPLRGAYFRWLFFAAGPVEAAVTAKMLGVAVPKERESMAGWGSYGAVMNVLESAVTGRDYVVGRSFTAADVYFGSQIGWGLMFGTVEKRPAFERYWERISARPAAARARAIDDALLPKKPA